MSCADDEYREGVRLHGAGNLGVWSRFIGVEQRGAEVGFNADHDRTEFVHLSLA